MAGKLFSSSWYRVAALKPSLRQHVSVQRHDYRNEIWYVLRDISAERHHRFNPSAYFIIALMNGKRTVNQIWEILNTKLGDDAPTQDEIIRLLGQLHAADILQTNVEPDAVELTERTFQQRKQKIKQYLLNPLTLRFTLVDPEKFLERGAPLVKRLFTFTAAVIWALVVFVALIVASANWPELTNNVFDTAFTAQNLLLLGLIYPIIKLLHELGHAFAVKVWGGEVHEMGIILLLLMPIPFVNASSASSFREKHKRIIVSAAGIMVELFLASLCLFIWVMVEPGIVRSICFNIMFIGSISTILFNGNPLLRYDGYYILADAVGIPNLAARSNKYIGYLIQRYVFGISEANNPLTTPSERFWLACYPVLSYLYRMFIMFFIVMLIADESLALGTLFAVWIITTQIIRPLVKHIHFILNNPSVGRQRQRAITTSVGATAFLFIFFVFIPMPLTTMAQGVISLPEDAQVRAGADGFITKVLAKTNSIVKKGDALFITEDPLIRTRVKILEAQLQELMAKRTAEWSRDRVQSEIIKEEISAAKADLLRAQERAASLSINSPNKGILIIPQAQDLPGQFVTQGQPIAYIVDQNTLTAEVVIPQDDIGLIRQGIMGIEVRLVTQLGNTISASIKREVPEASTQLPNAALGSLGGGPIAVDPQDESGTKSLQKTFQVELTLNESIPAVYIGSRVYVRFDHGSEPLARQFYRSLRQLFLRQLNV